MISWETKTLSAQDTETIGQTLGSLIKSGMVIELRSDLGGGKTTFTKGLVRGLGGKDRVSSPTFTLNKVYKAGKLEVHHFDFYRLSEPGVVKSQLEESVHEQNVITVVEWSDIVRDALPEDRIAIEFKAVPHNEDERRIIFEYPESNMLLIEKLRNKLTKTEP
jgi:tRNA threonylcarbamoyladenosine biosynthesis protein TsaE